MARGSRANVPQMRRYQAYRERLLRGPCSRQELAQAVECSLKTVQRDLAHLCGEWGWELQYSSRTRTWSAPGELPLQVLTLTDAEAQALLIAEPALRSYGGGPFGGALQSAVAKIIRSLDAPVSTDRPPVEFGLSAPRSVDQILFRRFAAAIRKQERLELEHFNPATGELTRREIDPHRLENYEGAWYVVAYCHLRKALRSFAVSPLRVQALRETGVRFESQPAAEVEQYLKRGFGMVRAHPPVDVVLRFAPQQAVYQQERQLWSGEQRTLEPGGSLTVRLRAPLAVTLARWLLQFGSEVEVLEPAALRETLRAECAKVVAMYAEG